MHHVKRPDGLDDVNDGQNSLRQVNDIAGHALNVALFLVGEPDPGFAREKGKDGNLGRFLLIVGGARCAVPDARAGDCFFDGAQMVTDVASGRPETI